MPKTAASAFDADAQAFITAAVITDVTQQNAINTLVVDLKGYSIWTKFKAIYPIVGGTASSHKYNLKDPRDLDAAFRLLFSTGWTHSANGMLPSSAFANTKLTPSTSLTLNTTHISLYSRTSTVTNATRDMGAFLSSSNPCMSLGTNTGVFISDHYNFNFRISSSIASATGFYLGTRTTTTSHKLYKNGSILGSNTVLSAGSLPPLALFLGAVNLGSAGLESAGAYSNKQYAFASIGDGLDDTEAANFYTAVQAYQTSLGRQV